MIEVTRLLAVTTMNLRYTDFRGHISLLCTLHGGSYLEQVKGPGWGTISLEADVGELSSLCSPEEADA